MRITTYSRIAVLGVTLAGTSLLAADDLFLPSYRPYLKTTPPEPAPIPVPAPGPKPVSPSPSRRPRFAWLRGDKRTAPALEPVAPPAATVAPGPTVAATLSVSASVPDYVPGSSRGLVGRIFRTPDPEVPPGLPRGSAPLAMIPPEPLAPALAKSTRRRFEPKSSLVWIGSTDPSANRSSYAAQPASAARSPLAPAQPRGEVHRLDRPVPFLIARPDESDSNRPLGRVETIPTDLDATRSSIS